MATVPTSGTNIRLLSGIPFSNDYVNSRWFDSLSQQTTYFLNKNVVHSMAEANFQRIAGSGQTYIAVNESIDELWGTNYVMFQNAQYNSKWFYGFVTKLEYVQKKTTYVHFEIDVLQTWLFDMNFKPSYIIREHAKLWNSDGSPVLNTIDEGLNYGSDYDIVDVQQYSPQILFLVVASKETLHIPNGQSEQTIIPNINGSPQPLSYYIQPFTVFGGGVNVSVGGVTFTLPSVQEMLKWVYESEDAINNVVSLYITDHVGIKYNFDSSNSVVYLQPNIFQELQFVSIADPIPNAIYVKESYTYDNIRIECEPKYLSMGGIQSSGKWSFPNIKESKLLMYPYTLSYMDDFKGNRNIIKNEYINGESLLVDKMGSMGTSNKVAYIPNNYLNEKISSNLDRSKVNLENALIDATPHDVAIINNMLASFLQGNRNALKNQIDSTLFNGITNSLGGIVGGVASVVSRNGLGMVSSGLNVVTGAGNMALEIEGIQAKLKDINNMPPQLQKMGSNTAFEYGNAYFGFWIITKQIKPEYQKTLSDYFNMFGYKINQVKIPNFHTRKNWNYIQTKNCNILGNFNNEDLQELKNIFNGGITLWHTDDVGNYNLSNGVIA